MNKTRILIVDDQPIICEGLNAILQLEDDLEVIGVCHNGQEALEHCEKSKPDIVLMDARMPVMNGIKATKQLLSLFPETKVLILTTFNEEELIFEGLQNGAKGFLLKDIQPEELCKCIRTVSQGGAYLHPDVTMKVLDRFSSQVTDLTVNNTVENGYNQLTNREKEVLRLIGRGLSNTEISSELFIAEGTVKNHVSNLLSKLEARDRTQLAIFAQKI